jgi:outer membrane lipoprotein-sorting protein
MIRDEKKLSRYIDELNNGKKPNDHKKTPTDIDYLELTNTVRRVHALREMEYPDELYQKRLIDSIIGGITVRRKNSKAKLIKRTLMVTTAAAAAAVLLFVSLDPTLPGRNTNIVYAMEQAIKEVKAYHGFLEVIENNELGETMTQAKREVWADLEGNYYIKELEGYSEGLITVNNGDQKWQLRPEEKEVYIFTAFPDPYRFTFELGNEIEDVKRALTVKKVGEEVISGREASILEVTPKGGAPYRLWIDKETDLPLQRETAMQNALQYKVTYTSIEFLDAIPEELLVYSLPVGYDEVNTNPEQMITSLDEAQSMVGFHPTIADSFPEGYTLDKITVLKNESVVKLYYIAPGQKTVIIQQSEANNVLTADANAILGTVNNNSAEIITAVVSSIRWQEQGAEFLIFGNATLEELKMFAEGLSEGTVVIPKAQDEIDNKPQVEIEVDLKVEENDQKSVDAGHSPWKLDPIFVAQVFASLLITPEGIIGDYPIPYDHITMIENNGAEAIVEINSDNTIAKYVYLKRLIRQDDTGIWTVVGYDLLSE